MGYLTASAGWVAPTEVSGWISPSEVSGWVSPAESAGWVSPIESGYGFDDATGMITPVPAPVLQSNPSLNEEMAQSGGQNKSKGNDNMVANILGAVIAPTFDAIKFWTGGSEIEMKEAEAQLADAQAKAEMAKAQALMGVRTKPPGMSTNTMLLLGGGALALFLILR
jgi:hypothetical protein